nr:IncI1 plasmid conjugative transfer pilus-tip adhesin protein PilV [Escherichia coli]
MNQFTLPFSTHRIGTVRANPVPDWHWPPCQSGIWTTAKVNFTTSTYNIGKNTRNLSIGVHAMAGKKVIVDIYLKTPCARPDLS